MIVCTDCGTRNADTDAFCGSCGSYLEFTGEASTQTAVTVVAEVPPDSTLNVVASVEPIDSEELVAARAAEVAAQAQAEQADRDRAAAEADARAAEAAAQAAAEEAERRRVAEEQRRAQAAALAEAEAARAAAAEAARVATERAEETRREAERQARDNAARIAAEEQARVLAEQQERAAAAAREAEAARVAEEQAAAEQKEHLAAQALAAKQRAEALAAEAAADAARAEAEAVATAAAHEADEQARRAAAEAEAAAQAKARADAEAAQAAAEAEAQAAAVEAERSRLAAEQEAERLKADAERRRAELLAAQAAARAEAAEADAKAAEAARLREDAERARSLVATPKAVVQAPVVTTSTEARTPSAASGDPDPVAMRPTDRVEQRRAVSPGPEHEPLNPGDLVCPACGAGNDPARKFCRRCGASLVTAAVVPTPGWWPRLKGKLRRKPIAAGARPGRKRAKAAKETRGGRKRRKSTGRLKQVFTILVGLAVVALGVLQATGHDLIKPFKDAFNKATAAPVELTVQSATATSSQGGHTPDMLIDGNLATWWAEGVAGPGKGQAVTLHLEQPTTLTKVRFYLGPDDKTVLYAATSAPTKIKLKASDGTVKELTLKDQHKAQTFDFSTKKPVTSVVVTIEGTRAGQKAQDTSITEIILFKAGA